MQAISVFQQQFPLSSRKILKKMIGKCVTSTFPAVLLGLFGIGAGIGMSLIEATRVSVLILLFIIFTLSFYLIFILGHYLYEIAYIRRYYYSADEHFLTIKKGVFAPGEIHVQYQKMQDVYVDQDLFDRVLGLYDVHIASATVTSGIEAHIDGVDVDVAEGLKNWLLGHVSGVHSNPTATMSESSSGTTGTVHVPGNISYQTFSIQKGWYVQSVFQALLLSLILGFWLGLSVFDKGYSEMGFVLSLAIIFVLFIFQMVMAVLWKKSFTWEFTPEFILTKEGIIGRRETHVPYRTIQDVMLSQSIFERLLGLCTVKVENATAVAGGSKGRGINRGPRFPGQSLSKGQELVEILKGIRASGSQQTGV